MNAIIFDFDGIIVDSEKKKFSNLQQLANNQKVVIEDVVFAKFIGRKRRSFLQEHFPELANQSFMDALRKTDSTLDTLQITEGLKKFLEKHKQNYVFAIATGSNRSFVEKTLAFNDICSFFKVIITGDDVSVSKPNPKPYTTCLEKLNVDTAYVIEDSPAGVLSAKQAGCTVIALERYIELPDAHVRCTTYEEITEYIDSDH